MKNDLILIGGGGHCRSCIDVIEDEGSFLIKGIVDKSELVGHTMLKYKFIGIDDDIPKLAKQTSHFFLTLGQIKSSARRHQLFDILKALGLTLPVLVSPRAYVSKHASIGEGSIIMLGAIINAGASIGKNAIVNTNAIVEHDAEIGDFCHVSTGAVINGGTIVGNDTFIGSNSVVREGIEIGDNCIIGLGTKVFRSISAHSVIK